MLVKLSPGGPKCLSNQSCSNIFFYPTTTLNCYKNKITFLKKLLLKVLLNRKKVLKIQNCGPVTVYFAFETHCAARTSVEFKGTLGVFNPFKTIKPFYICYNIYFENIKNVQTISKRKLIKTEINSGLKKQNFFVEIYYRILDQTQQKKPLSKNSSKIKHVLPFI